MTEGPTSRKQPVAYDTSVLSEEEKDRFLSALGDGFGYSRRGQDFGEATLPAEVEAGLLKHRAYYDRTRRSEHWNGDENEKEEFWEQSDGDSPPGLLSSAP